MISKIPSFKRFIVDNKLVLSSLTPVSGGSIASSFKVVLSGKSYFVKTYGREKDNHYIEANSLELLRQGLKFKVPKVIHVNDDFILLEYIESGSKGPYFYEKFGRQLAEFHEQKSDHIGLKFDNYIGETHQQNTWIKIDKLKMKQQWIEYFWQYRIQAQLNLVIYPDSVKEKLSHLKSDIDYYFEDWIPHIGPIHGDLWGQNHLCGISGEVCLIDPAFYYGCPEADLALIGLFINFPDEFWTGYQHVRDIPQGFEQRKNLYRLYHLMNHYYLFSGGYLTQIEKVLASL